MARTAFGFGLESEHHDLTVQLKPRSGTQDGTHVIGLAGLDGSFFDQRVVTGSAAQSITWRVPPGTYSAGAISFDLAADGAKEGVLTYDPEVAVHSAKTITLDGDEAARFGHSVDQPVSSDGQFMGVFWNTSTGGTGFTFAGNADRLYAKPLRSSADRDGRVLSQLDALAAGCRAHRTGLPGAADVIGRQSRPREPGLPRRRRGLGRCAADRVRRNAIALVAGDCGDLGPAAAALSAAGAVAVVAYAGTGADCAGTIGEAALPVFEARPFDVLNLLKRNRPAQIVMHESPHYIYDLAGAWNGFVPNGAVLEGATRKLGAIVERYDSLGPAAGDGHQVWAMPSAGCPAATPHWPRPARGGAEHGHALRQPDRGMGANGRGRDAGVTEGFLSAPRHAFAAGTTKRDQWFGGPITSRVAPPTAPWDYSSPYRQEDYVLLGMPPFVDQAGHQGGVLYLDEFAGQLFQDGELIAEGRRSALCCRHSCRRSATTSGSSTRSSATTPSGSDRAERRPNGSSARSGPEGDHEILPCSRSTTTCGSRRRTRRRAASPSRSASASGCRRRWSSSRSRA